MLIPPRLLGCCFSLLLLQYYLCLQYLRSPLCGVKSPHVQTMNDRIRNVLWFSSDAVLLHSLCKMFGLLDSVKQAVELKRRRDEDSRAQNRDIGGIAAARSTRCCPRTFNGRLSCFSVLDKILGEEMKRSCDKSSSCKTKSLRPLRAQCQRMSSRSVIQPLSVTGGSPYAELTINPQLLATFSTSNGQRHHARGSRRNKDHLDGLLEGDLVQMAGPEKIPRLRQEPAGPLREPAGRTERRQAGTPGDTERVGFGRKKRKSK